MTNTNNKTQVQFLLWQAVTPVHPGTGQVSASVIDLPVAREGATSFPVLPASSIKGVLRDGDGLREGDDQNQSERVRRARKLFGYANQAADAGAEPDSAAGDLSFTDARLFALSVPSYHGTYALVTCPMILQRLSRDRTLLGLNELSPVRLGGAPKPAAATSGAFADPASMMGLKRASGTNTPAATGAPKAHVSQDTVLIYEKSQQIILQDLDFEPVRDATVDDVLKVMVKGLPEEDARLVRERLCVVDDDVFAFLSETATEVTAHVRLEPDRKTVIDGALWYEETIPAETLFTSFVMSRSGEGLDVLQQRPYLQVGGKGSVGRGLLRLNQGDRA